MTRSTAIQAANINIPIELITWLLLPFAYMSFMDLSVSTTQQDCKETCTIDTLIIGIFFGSISMSVMGFLGRRSLYHLTEHTLPTVNKMSFDFSKVGYVSLMLAGAATDIFIYTLGVRPIPALAPINQALGIMSLFSLPIYAFMSNTAMLHNWVEYGIGERATNPASPIKPLLARPRWEAWPKPIFFLGGMLLAAAMTPPLIAFSRLAKPSIYGDAQWINEIFIAYLLFTLMNITNGAKLSQYLTGIVTTMCCPNHRPVSDIRAAASPSSPSP